MDILTAEGSPCVKREVVSITNAVHLSIRDIPTAQNAVYRLNSASSLSSSSSSSSSSCKKCLKERQGRSGRWKQKQARKPTKSNTPIVIQLADTLKAALKQKQKTLAESVLKPKMKDSHEDPAKRCSDGSIMSTEEVASNKEIRTKKDVKNLSALISVIEKSHQKESQCNVGSNLAKNTQKSDCKFVANYVLNNAAYSYDGAENNNKPRNIVECENVDIICNDLNGSEKSSMVEDSESDNGSTISSVDVFSDSDVSSTQPDNTESEMSQEELEWLAQYTTGCPLIRYNCPPAECPQCLAELYSSQYYYGFDSYEVHELGTQYPESTDVEEKGQVAMETESEDSDSDNVLVQTNGAVESPTLEFQNEPSDKAQSIPIRNPDKHKTSKSQLIDIDIAGRGKSQQDPLNDSVYIDLTDTDVSYTVYYQHDFSQTDQDSPNYATVANPMYLPSSHQLMAASMTTNPYLNLPYWYWPYMYPPLYSLPTTIYLPEDSQSIPKTLLIPPKELEKFNSTAPPTRHWVPINTPERNRPTAIFTVMCYNVLCDKYCTRQFYGYCPSWALNWEYRKKGIMDEIKHCGADIISLQEVETDQFHNFFLPELRRDGYDGIFSAKSRARTMTEADRKHVDGCAIFYKVNKFSLMKEHLIEFNQLAMANAEGSDDMLNRVMTKDNIGLAAMLETKEGVYENGMPPESQVKQPIMVATAHIHWDPEFSDVKLIQTMMLMWKLQHIIEDNLQCFRPNSGPVNINSIPLILCGDLNSLPESGVVEYLVSGKVARTHEDFKDIGYQDVLQKINGSKDKDSFCHEFKLAKAYEDDVMPFTNYTYDFKGIIDYIFYSKDHMNLLGLLGPLDEDWFRQNKVVGCPHPHVPSDHFPLLVEYEMPIRPFAGGQSNSTNNASLKHR